MLVLPAHRVEAEGAADALLAALADPLQVDGTEVIVAASIGLATARDASTGAEALLRDADTAMYRAKAEGRRRWVVFDPAMHRAPAGADGAGAGAARGAGDRPAARRVPADRADTDRRGDRRRGAGSLAAPGPRAGAAGRPRLARTRRSSGPWSRWRPRWG